MLGSSLWVEQDLVVLRSCSGCKWKILYHMSLHPGPDIVLLYTGCGGMGQLCVAAINDLLFVSLQGEKRHIKCSPLCGGAKVYTRLPSIQYLYSFVFCDRILKFLCLVVSKLLRIYIVKLPAIRCLDGRDDLYYGLDGCNSVEHICSDMLSRVVKDWSSIFRYL